MVAARRKVDLLQGMLSALQQQQSQQQQGARHPPGRPAAAVASFATLAGSEQQEQELFGVVGDQVQGLRAQLSEAQVGGQGRGGLGGGPLNP